MKYSGQYILCPQGTSETSCFRFEDPSTNWRINQRLRGDQLTASPIWWPKSLLNCSTTDLPQPRLSSAFRRALRISYESQPVQSLRLEFAAAGPSFALLHIVPTDERIVIPTLLGQATTSSAMKYYCWYHNPTRGGGKAYVIEDEKLGMRLKMVSCKCLGAKPRDGCVAFINPSFKAGVSTDSRPHGSRRGCNSPPPILRCAVPPTPSTPNLSNLLPPTSAQNSRY